MASASSPVAGRTRSALERSDCTRTRSSVMAGDHSTSAALLESSYADRPPPSARDPRRHPPRDAVRHHRPTGPAYGREAPVAFLLGCSFTFEWALLEAGIRLWHVEHGRNVAMWRTSIECRPAGAFHGPMVVSMRPIPSAQLSKAVTASARFPGAHGAPVHIGDPAAIGITDIARPDWGDAQPFRPRPVPAFWACGVTPQAVALASKPPFMLTHSPGHMFITDLPNAALAAF